MRMNFLMPGRSAIILALAFLAAFGAPRGDLSVRAQGRGTALDSGASYLYAPSFSSLEGPLHALGSRFDAGFTLGMPQVWGFLVPVRAELGVYGVGDSAYSASLFRFRGFWGFRLAALAGAGFPVGASRIQLLAGGALSASQYTNLSAVTAYPSLLAEARFLVPLAPLAPLAPLFGKPGTAKPAAAGPGIPDLVISLPVEYMFRGTARTVAAGIGLGMSLDLPAKGLGQ